MEQNLHIRPGWFLRVEDPGHPGKFDFVFVEKREPAYYLFQWPNDVAVNSEDGPQTVNNIRPLALDSIHQCWFGVRGPSYVYLNLPTNSRLNGTGPSPSATSSLREVGWWTEDTTPYWGPNPATEFFLMKGGNFEYPAFTAYNGTFQARRPQVRISMNKLTISPVRSPDVLNALKRNSIPFRPVTFGGLGAVRSGPG